MSAKLVRIVRVVMVATLIAALTAPVALAGPGAGKRQAKGTGTARNPGRGGSGTQSSGGSGKGAGSGKHAGSGQPPANLKKRISRVLAARKSHFDAAEANLSARVARLTVIADKIDAAGGDSSGARSLIAAAQASLGKAASLESAAVSQFQAVPTATNRRAAFRAARAGARLAAMQLVRTRIMLRGSVHALRTALAALASQEPSASPAAGTTSP